jgi:eukaryotic-like serine/threonine-protein kinase
MLPTTIARYRILERIGQGGMGVVYRAEDPRLEREVAIKILREDTLRDEKARLRFRAEARALSRLLHPHVATLFDLDSENGVDFLVLEFVPGETLADLIRAGALPERRARAIATEVAEALEAAHEQGIVHRDLKPGNVAITPRGRAKVLDFGLARFLAETADGAPPVTASDPNILAGTLPYMAPEQLSGEPLDARTDLYALGVMLFEMTTGRRPFAGTTPAQLVYQIANQRAPLLRERHPGLSVELERIVDRCLEKSPSRRFPDAAALIRALRGEDSQGGAGPAVEPSPEAGATDSSSKSTIRSLAVLPFQNRSGDLTEEYFADGMTDALITNLAQIGALRVISRTSAMRFKGATRPLPEIARELHVDAIIEGSALRAGDRVRITVQLVEAATDSSLWAKSYERDLTDILTLQSEVAHAIAREIRVQVTPEESARLKPKGPVNPTAHVAYLQGRFLWNRWNAESVKQSVVRYEEALAVDPSYALAWAGLADSYGTLGNTNALPPGIAYPRSQEAAERGIALDPTLAEPHTSLGYVHHFHGWNWPLAEREYQRALELNPGYASGRARYARFLAGMDRHDEAIVEAERALELDPLSLIIHTAVGDVLYFARRYERAIGYYRRCLGIDPTFGPGHTDLSRTLEQTGQLEEAVAEFLKATPVQEGRPQPSTGLAILLARAGRRDEAEAMIGEILAPAPGRFVPPFGVASYFAVVGDNARSLDWLERAHSERDGALVWLKVHPRLDGLRGEPRFRELLRAMRLEA